MWLLLLVPCIAPPLLGAYAYAGFSHSVLHRPLLKELVYAMLLVFRLVPVAVVAFACVPRGTSQEAIHCHRLLRGRRPALQHLAAHVRLLLRGELGAGFVAGALVFLLAFAEFEQASLLSMRHWTVALFDAQAGGHSLAESLGLAVMPVACGLPALLPALWVLRGLCARETPVRHASPSSRHMACTWTYLAFALAGGAVLPATVMLRGTVEGLEAFLKGFSLQREIAAGLGVAVAAAACTYLIAGLVMRPRLNRKTARRSLALQEKVPSPGNSAPTPSPALRRARVDVRARVGDRVGVGSRVGLRPTRLLLVAACIPGLLGALVLALAVQCLFQLPGIRAVYDTPLPLLTGLVLYLFPFAVLLSHALDAGPFDTSSWTARLLKPSPHATVRSKGKELLWRLHYRRQFWLFGLLFFLAYFDVTVSSILAPTGLPSVTSRLYNFMHYGRSAVLSTMLCCTTLTAAVAMAGLYAAGREGVRRHG